MGNDRDSGDNISTRLTYFLVGAGIGAVLALLFAPKSGEELRNDIADATRKGIDRSKEAASQLGAKATEYYDTTKQKAGEYYDSARETAEEYYEATRERAADLYDTATTKAGKAYLYVVNGGYPDDAGDYQGQRHSALKQITAENAGSLVPKSGRRFAVRNPPAK